MMGGARMHDGWQLYRFDYNKFLEIKPSLRSATTPAALAALSDNSDTQAIVDALMEGRIAVAEARQLFLTSLCCTGDPLPISRRFPRKLSQLMRQKDGIDAGETLSELFAGGRNLEPWMKQGIGLCGFLSSVETMQLLARLPASFLDDEGSRSGGRNRGVFRGLVRFLQTLFDREPPLEELTYLIGDMIEMAVKRGEGLAALTDG